MTDRKFMTVSQLQSYMNISRNTAYELTARDDFPSIRVNAKILVPTDLLDEWVKKQASSKGGV